MKVKLLLIIIMAAHLSLIIAQKKDIWESYIDEKNELIGFKDSNGKVRIPPRFSRGLTSARKFENIIVVTEQIDSSNYSNYYLLKNGTKIGYDSIYLWDNAADCESEGLIRFRSNKDEMVGFYDKNGTVAIPALYNDALPFRNGMAIVIQNARKTCLGGKLYSKDECEHWEWEGGKTMLINTKNEVLIEDFTYTDKLDWRSVKIADSAGDAILRDFFQSKDGRFYSFVNFEKEFKLWFTTSFLNTDNISKLIQKSFSEITTWVDSSNGWESKETSVVMSEMGAGLIRMISEFQKGTLEYEIVAEELNPFIFTQKIYTSFFDNCGNAISWKYPLFDVVVSYNDANGKLQDQDHLEFIKTSDGYRLISFNIKNR